MPEPPQSINGNSLDVHYGRAGVVARGIGAIVILCSMAIVASNVWVGFRVEHVVEAHDYRVVNAVDHHRVEMAQQESKWRDELRRLRLAQNRTTCVNLFDFKERKDLRGSGVDWLKVCPWIEQ